MTISRTRNKWIPVQSSFVKMRFDQIAPCFVDIYLWNGNYCLILLAITRRRNRKLHNIYYENYQNCFEFRNSMKVFWRKKTLKAEITFSTNCIELNNQDFRLSAIQFDEYHTIYEYFGCWLYFARWQKMERRKKAQKVCNKVGIQSNKLIEKSARLLFEKSSI